MSSHPGTSPLSSWTRLSPVLHPSDPWDCFQALLERLWKVMKLISLFWRSVYNSVYSMLHNNIYSYPSIELLDASVLPNPRALWLVFKRRPIHTQAEVLIDTVNLRFTSIRQQLEDTTRAWPSSTSNFVNTGVLDISHHARIIFSYGRSGLQDFFRWSCVHTSCTRMTTTNIE